MPSKGRSGTTIPSGYFRRLYQDVDDPWDFEHSAYERAKYERTLASLPKARYARALELACSIGVFTAMLAPRCDALSAVDVSEDAVARAAQRCATLPHVRVAACDLSVDFPAGRYDLITLCEAGFYFSPPDLARIRDAIVGALDPGGDLVLVHWTPLVEGHAQTADDVHAAFGADGRLRRAAHERAETYVLDAFTRA